MRTWPDQSERETSGATRYSEASFTGSLHHARATLGFSLEEPRATGHAPNIHRTAEGLGTTAQEMEQRIDQNIAELSN